MFHQKSVGFDSPRFKRAILIVFSVLLVSGILQRDVSGQSQAVQERATPDQVERNWKKSNFKFDVGWNPVTDPETAKSWGMELEKTMKSGDLNAVSKLIDFDPVMMRCVAGVTNEEFRKGFLIGVKQGTGNLLNQLAHENTSYVFRGVRNNEFGACALMRMLDVNGGCNYHIWHLQKNSHGNVVGVDLYVFLSGETFGNTVRRLTLLSVPQDDRSFFQKLTGTEKTISKNQVQMMKIIQGSQQKQFQAVLNAYDQLPSNLKKEKALMVMRILSAFHVDEAAYVKALEEFQTEHPGDASADLAGIDLYFLKKEYDKMDRSLKRLESAVGADGHLSMLRAVAFSQQGKLPEARKELQSAISIEPQLEQPHWTLVEISLAEKNFDLVNDTLKKLANKFGYNEFDFSGNELYAEYVKSEQHHQFREFLKTIK